MMMDYGSMTDMMGGNSGMAMGFMWITYIIVLIDLLLGGIALGKYLVKK